MKRFIVMIVAATFILAPVCVLAAEMTGSIQGLTCVTQGRVCPVGMEDPVIAAEEVFVLLVDAAQEKYYFIPNVDRAVLARHINEQVKVVGTVNERLKSIKADELYTMTTDNNWKKVYTTDWRDDIYRDFSQMGARPVPDN
ncbi:MAG: hypothetical protein M0P57_02135 [Syntrophales bacterium]|nr:hypothetical protein [Syntrophales bacterium]MDY0043582.1 hypothetical protein [Syntrophales bacterium]